MNWGAIGKGLRLAYLLRVPLFFLLLLAAFGPFSLWSNLLANLLDQAGDGWYLFLVSFTAFLLAFTAVTTLNLILYYGNLRFEGKLALELSQKRPLLTFLSGCVAAAVLDTCVYLRSIPESGWNSVPLALGAITAFVCVFAAKVVQLALTDPKSTPHPPPFLVFPAYLIRPLERLLDDIYCWSSGWSRVAKNRLGALGQWPLEILRPAGQGYLINLKPAPGEKLKLQSGQVFALSLFVIAFLFYLGIAYAKGNITAVPAKVPALAFVLLFFIVACWSLATLTFFFDRYRFPLLWTLAILSAITLFVPQSDHFFRVERFEPRLREPLTAPAYLKARLKKEGGKKRLILIATPGGGIQAAAWTAQVVSGLEGKYSGFRESVAAVSSVSGGSLGSIIYAASFAKKIKPCEVARNALQPAIDEVAWGWTVPDFWRTMAPWFRKNRTIDRGWALEKKWAAINNLDDTGDKRGTMLSDWSEAARAGNMPALLINSMLVESGQPVVFSNTRFPSTPRNFRIKNFYDLYPAQRGSYDIRVNTAARLSASFSYVAPAARPDLDAPFAPGYHFVDGGYYDNFGISSLLAWLGEALEDEQVLNDLRIQDQGSGGQSAKPIDILILQIRHFNASGPAPGPKIVGWGFQILAPGVALYNMRDFAQNAVAHNQLQFFARYYATQNIDIWDAHVDYNGSDKCKDAPLSWKLDATQQQCIGDTWSSLLQSKPAALDCIDDYLAGKDPKIHCENPANEGGQ